MLTGCRRRPEVPRVLRSGSAGPRDQRQGDHRAAARSYARAVERAPNWGALRLAWDGQANEIFFVLDHEIAARLKAAGAVFHQVPAPAWMDNPPEENEFVGRLVASFATTTDDIDRFLAQL